jgi:phosphoribosylamine--glycine ligase
VPTAVLLAVARPPCVVKADGHAAGKGVWICETQAELDHALRLAASLGDRTVIEQLLTGPELSVFALVAGSDFAALPSARDYSRVGDGDTGPNTGGMGCFSPVPDAPELVDSLLRPVVEQLARRGSPFIGCLYGGIILTEDGPRVLEFNCRFGDPETQVLMPRLAGDLLPTLAAAARGNLDGVSIGETDDAAVAVAMAAGTYPDSGDTGTPIEGIEDAEAAGAIVFHAGTALRDGRLVTNGGRILNVTGIGDTISEARERAYAGVERIRFEGGRYRKDIALAEEAPVG